LGRVYLKERATPLTRQTAAVLRAWLPEAGPAPTGPAFPTHRGTRMSADAVQRLVAKHGTAAAGNCPSISSKQLTPHTLRHTAAMTLLHAGVDTSVIALWHQSPVTTHIYLHADMTIKERALARIPELNSTPGRYRPADDLIHFLERLKTKPTAAVLPRPPQPNPPNSTNTTPRPRHNRNLGVIGESRLTEPIAGIGLEVQRLCRSFGYADFSD
jgi:hypothetical protein